MWSFDFEMRGESYRLKDAKKRRRKWMKAKNQTDFVASP